MLTLAACKTVAPDGSTRSALWEEYSELRPDGCTVQRRGADRDTVKLIIAGVVSVAVPSPLPLVATILAAPLIQIGNSIAALVRTPAEVIDRATTTTERIL